MMSDIVSIITITSYYDDGDTIDGQDLVVDHDLNRLFSIVECCYINDLLTVIYYSRPLNATSNSGVSNAAVVYRLNVCRSVVIKQWFIFSLYCGKVLCTFINVTCSS